MKNKFVILGFLLVFSLIVVSADVGLGISPSKMKEQVVSGETYHYNILVFNTGDQDIDVNLVVNGEISEFIEIVNSTAIILPEPLPHEFPIKNGVEFEIVAKIPKSSGEKIYSGSISAIGGGLSTSRLGGNVGVSTQLEFVVLPSDSIFKRIPSVYYFILGIVLFLVFVTLILKKAGFHVEFNTQSKKK